ncbi:hypothetical protein QQ045_029449 [Rhodiola kirilowii]
MSPIRKVGLTMFRLFLYSPDYDPRRESATTTKWVRLPGLAPPLFTRRFVEAIVSSFAFFLDVDERSKACATLKYARACVEIDVSKPVPEEVIISLPDGRKYTQKIEVEGNLFYCSRCKIHGHSINNCRKQKRRQEEDGCIWEACDEHGIHIVKTQVAAPEARVDQCPPTIAQDSVPMSAQTEAQSLSVADNKAEGWLTVRKRKGKKGKIQ